MNSDMPVKRCGICKETYPATTEYFEAHKGCKYGVVGTCRKCNRLKRQSPEYKERKQQWDRDSYQRNIDKRRAYDRDRSSGRKDYNRQWEADHKSHRRDYARGRYWSNPDHFRAQKRADYQRHRDQRLEKAKASYSLARDRKLAYAKEWRNSPRGRARLQETRPRRYMQAHNRRARKRALLSDFTERQWIECLAYWNHKCAACGRDVIGLWHTVHADHWIPLASPDCPGTTVTNMICLCGGVNGCNESKGDKPAEQWLIDKFGKHKALVILKRVNDYFDWVREREYVDSAA